jgi:hypothetical protein
MKQACTILTVFVLASRSLPLRPLVTMTVHPSPAFSGARTSGYSERRLS